MPLLGSCQPTGLPAWSREGAIGDYGGSPDKGASGTEGDTPYTFTVYRELQAQRGSAYTQATGTLVHCENLALARTLAATFFRLPEKYRANATPAHSDERLEYWATVLAVPFSPTSQRWQVRQNCAAAYRAVTGPTFANVYDSVASLLGGAFVTTINTVGTDLANPPTPTYWTGVNPGPSSYSLGGGDWASPRAHLTVTVQIPAGMTQPAFLDLCNVQLFQLLDRMLPIWATFNWSFGDTTGFLLDISQLDLQGFN